MRIGWLWMCGALVPTVAAMSSVASADEFVTLDRQDRVSSAGIEASYIDLKNNDGNDSSTLFRFDGHAQYVTPAGFGGYVTIPWSYVSETGSSNAALGNIELGGIFVLPKQSPNLDIVLHLGVGLPTGSSDLGGLLQNVVASTARYSDFYLAAGDLTSLRLGASALYHSGALIARVDVGLDTTLSHGNDSGDADTILRLDGGVGVDLSHQALVMAELVNIYDPGGDGSFTDNVANVGALSFRYTGAQVHPYVALVLPLDDNTKAFVSTAVTIGIDARLK